MRVMGIDPSTSTGVAVLDRHGFQETKLLHFPSAKGFDRLQLIATGVANVVEDTNPDAIYIEGYAYGNKNTLVCLVEVGTSIRAALHKLGRTWTEIQPTQLKLFIAGSGSAKKPDMAHAISEKWGFHSASDDVVDAYGLAQLGLAVLLDGVTFQPKKPKKRSKK